MNRLRQEGIVRDWAVYGAVAYSFHEEPVSTRDIDIIVLADDMEYAKVFSAMSRLAKPAPGTMDFLVGDLPVQVFPTSINSPLFEDALKQATEVDIAGEPGKVLPREHLIILPLQAFRPAKDYGKIMGLLPRADPRKLELLLERFDIDGKLAEKLRWLTSGPP